MLDVFLISYWTGCVISGSIAYMVIDPKESFGFRLYAISFNFCMSWMGVGFAIGRIWQMLIAKGEP